MDVGIHSVFVFVCQDAPAWCVMQLYGQKVLSYMLAVLGLSLVDFVCFSRSLSSIAQIRSEEWFLNHENDPEGFDTLRILSTAWFVMRHKIQGT